MGIIKPNNLDHLAEILDGSTFNRLTLIANSPEEFNALFENIKEEEMCRVDEFARYIPVIREIVSVKKHDYNLKQYNIYHLTDGSVYIHDPLPTIELNRQGSRLQTFKRNTHLMIPHNCPAFDVLALKVGCTTHDKKVFRELTITRYKQGGWKNG